MKIKPRHFPHPVLSHFYNDFIDSTFDAEVKSSIDTDSFNFQIDFKLENPQFRELIAFEKAKFVVHIECKKTWIRRAHKTSDFSIKISIPADQLSNQADVCVFIVAEEDLSNYRNDKFHPDFDGETFYVKKGEILAIGSEVSVQINKQPLEKVSSIFQLVQDANYKEGEMTVNVDSDKIVVSLSKKSHSRYQQLIQDPKLIPVFHSMIAVPALVYALSYIRELLLESQSDMDDFTSSSWYRTISKKLEELNVNIEDPVELEDSVNLAVKLVNKPMSKAMDAIKDNEIN